MPPTFPRPPSGTPADGPGDGPGDGPDGRPGGPGGDPLAVPGEFRPGGVRVLAVAWWVLAAVLAADLLLNSDLPGELPGALAGVALLGLSCALVHALFWHPAVRADVTGVELVNVWRRVHLPWSTLTDLDTRWALTLEAGGRRWTAWAAPASGRRFRAVQRREAPWAARGAEGIEGSRAPGSSAGEAAVLVESRWERWRTAPTAERATGTGETRTAWCPSSLVPTAVSLALLLLALLLP
ncbi:PH domain-containing protein [Aquipuribacter sp. SD81]|uniref:PH domain-containing protein n=1 Tax=Aquipuribacter sp. SD81 TaxID=3127703 RepID=UPI003019278C